MSIYKYLYENNIIDNIDYINESNNSDIQNIKDILKHIEVNMSKLNTKFNDTSNKIYSIINRYGYTKESCNSISNIIISFYDNFIEWILPSDIELFRFKYYDANKIKNAILLDRFNVIVNTFMYRILSKIFNSDKIGLNIMAILIAPINEEFGKYASIRLNCKKEYFIIFNIGEFYSYANTNQLKYDYKYNNKDKDISFKQYKIKRYIARLCAVIEHGLYTYIQDIFNDSNNIKSLGLDPDNEDDRKKMSFIGYLITTILHLSSNLRSAIEQYKK